MIMSHHSLAILLLSLLFCSCKKTTSPKPAETKDVEHPSKIELLAADRTLDEYRALAPKRPIVAVFTMKRDLIGHQFIDYIELNRAQLFPTEHPLFLKYDCDGAGIGTIELKKRGVPYLPVIFVTYGGDWVQSGRPNDYLNGADMPYGFQNELRRILTAAKLAVPRDNK